MITDGIKWHYLAVSNLSALLAKKSWNHDGEFYCLNYLIHTPQRINLKNMKKYVIITTAVVYKYQNGLKKYWYRILEKNH